MKLAHFLFVVIFTALASFATFYLMGEMQRSSAVAPLPPENPPMVAR